MRKKFLLLAAFLAVFCLLGVDAKSAKAMLLPEFSFSPANGQTSVASTTDLSITFTFLSAVATGTSGNLYVKKWADGSVVETVPFNSKKISHSEGGGNIMNIDLSMTLQKATMYYVNVEAGMFIDADTLNPTSAITGSSTWYFITKSDEYMVTKVKQVYGPSGFTKVNGVTYFFGATPSDGLQLWRTDGTGDNTTMITDVNPGSGGMGGIMARRQIQTLGNEMFFIADDGEHGTELWKSDGTALGTAMIKDINPGADPSLDGNGNLNGVVYNGEMYFVANNGTNGNELWKTDGTDSGTKMVKDIYVGANSGSPSGLIVANNWLLFAANDGTHLTQLWRSDGTDSGTQMVKQIGTSNVVLADFSPILYDNFIIFAADDDVLNNEPWRSDGTAGGTVKIREINPSTQFCAGGSSPSNFMLFNDKVFFDTTISSSDYADREGLWYTDGTESGTIQYPYGGFPQFILNGRLFLEGFHSDGSGYLESTQGDGEEPMYLRNISDNAGNFTSCGTEECFVNSDGVSGYELWKTNGNIDGTFMVADINPGSGDSVFGNESLDNVMGNLTYIDAEKRELYFSADDGTNGQFWKMYRVSTSTLAVPIVSGITDASANASSSITNNGKGLIRERGFLWGTSGMLSVESYQNIISETGYFSTGSFSAPITGLNCGTTYYVRPFAYNEAGYSYGTSDSFTTSVCPCATVNHAASYNIYPTCGAATCSSGYTRSGSGAAATCVLSSGSSGTVYSAPSPTVKPVEVMPIADLNNTDQLQPELISAPVSSEQTRIAQINAYIETKLAEQATKKETAAETFARAAVLGDVKGRIVLQVQSKGEAWYVNPNDSKRYYLGRPVDMFNVMRYFGLGAKHSTITGNIYYPERLWGKILIDVQDKGKAYYINPVDKKKYYLGRPEDAFKIVRNLGLGITTANLEKIWVNKGPTAK